MRWRADGIDFDASLSSWHCYIFIACTVNFAAGCAAVTLFCRQLWKPERASRHRSLPLLVLTAFLECATSCDSVCASNDERPHFCGSPGGRSRGTWLDSWLLTAASVRDLESPRTDRIFQAGFPVGAVGRFAIGVASREKRYCWLHLARMFPSLRVVFAISFADLGKQAVSVVFHFAQHLGNRRIPPHVSERRKR